MVQKAALSSQQLCGEKTSPCQAPAGCITGCNGRQGGGRWSRQPSTAPTQSGEQMEQAESSVPQPTPSFQAELILSVLAGSHKDFQVSCGKILAALGRKG